MIVGGSYIRIGSICRSHSYARKPCVAKSLSVAFKSLFLVLKLSERRVT